MHISRENSAIGLVTRRAPTPEMENAPVMEQCALVLPKVRFRLATFNLRRARFDLRDGNPVRKLRPEVGKEFNAEIQIETPQLSDEKN
jgi:hypothetical protein